MTFLKLSVIEQPLHLKTLSQMLIRLILLVQ